MLALWIWTSLIGCGPGTLSHPGGSEPLATAWWRHYPNSDERTELVLSNGFVPCAYSDLLDEQHQQDLLVSACREGARHLWVQLVGSTGPWLGTPDALNPLYASSYAVYEAEVTSVDGLARDVVITDYEFVYGASEGGEASGAVEDDEWVGRVNLPAIDTSVRVRAQHCEDDGAFDAFALIFSNGGCL